MADQNDVPDIEVDFPIPGGLRVTREQPYLILLVSDLAGSPAGAVAGPLADGVVEVNATNFDEVMRAARPSTRFTLTDPLAPGNVMAEVSLAFSSLKAFDPRELAAQIPPASRMLALRDEVVGRMRGKASAATLAETIARAVREDVSLSWAAESIKPGPAAAPAPPEVVDDLLGQLDLGGEQGSAAAPPKSPIAAAVAAAAGAGGLPAEESAALRRTLAELDRRIGAWLSAVLHAPQVLALEAAWRGVAFVVKNIDFRRGLRLSLLHAPRAELADRLVQKLIDPVFDAGAESPDVIVIDSQFDNSAADLEVLDTLGQHAASLPAVCITGVGSGFFGVKHAWQIATLPPLISMFDQWQFAKWKSLRGQAYARQLAVVFGRGLLREPFGRGEAGDLERVYREDAVTDKDFVWAGGALAAACTIARSVAATGWPTAMAGYVHGRVEGFAQTTGGPKGDKRFGPADTETPLPKVEELAVAGINALVSVKDHGDALFCNGLTAARPAKMDPTALLEVSLPYQLFATRLSALLFALKPHLSGKSAEELSAFVLSHVRDWLTVEGEAPPEQISVQARPAEQNPAALQLALTVTPPPRILPGGIPVVMGYVVT